MAKSFKQSVPKQSVEDPKPASERDFLDFLEEDHLTTIDSGESNFPKASTSNNKNISNTSNINNASVTDIDVVERNNVADVTGAVMNEVDVRQTFIISDRYLDQLKDYVHTRRITGEYDYTQKQALHDALDMLFAGISLTPRPAHIRQLEEKRKDKIRKGKAQ
ncbi:hypothetical protein J0X19_23900 [Hymenobacter sp. BT186]|uniref:DUF3408 domain-containing protein n=1 Tax=Hymenobacter telluris TaxID=2816474 RepID=A0A939F1A8_9BACT|nr:hypothetical protein [Hymenobacter telluris]MBO0361024.1 hypothetical protein [Hymenobacter telluris]MBW3377052.1 hypothetical protein [Hymenobacter norwichensis]